MMKHTNIFSFVMVLALFLAMTVTACDDFGSVNENPNAPSKVDKNPELILTLVEKSVADEMVNNAWDNGNLMAQYAAKIVFTNFDLFNWGSQNGFWENHYTNIRSANTIEEIGHDGYKAVALILKAYMFHNLTDMYGSIPFDEAVSAKSDKLYTPTYNSQEEVYNGILQMLEQANNLINDQTPGIKGDIIYDGDLSKWKKFANSLRLRVYMRLSEVDANKASLGINTIFSSLDANPVFTSNDDVAQLTYLDTRPNAFPKSQAQGNRSGSYDEYRLSETLSAYLKEYNDPRLQVWFDPTNNSVDAGTPIWEGMKNGLADGVAYVYKGGSAFLSKFRMSIFFNSPNTAKAVLMNYAEVEFIWAEAAMKGWINTDASNAYYNGIKASFDYWNVSGYDAYITQDNVSYSNNLERIITQKWIAQFMVGFEGYNDYRRTNFPTQIAPGPNAIYPNYPSRFMYPQDEQALNKTNYQNAAKGLQPNGDDVRSKVWWDVN